MFQHRKSRAQRLQLLLYIKVRSATSLFLYGNVIATNYLTICECIQNIILIYILREKNDFKILFYTKGHACLLDIDNTPYPLSINSIDTLTEVISIDYTLIRVVISVAFAA